MAAPLLPLQSTPANRPINRAVIFKWICVLLMIWALASWQLRAPIIPPYETKVVDALVLDGFAVDASPYTEKSESQDAIPVAAPARTRKHTDRVAVVIEDRPLGNLVPVLLHFHSVLGPEWPIILYTSQQTAAVLLRSAPFSRAVASSEVEIRYLPANTTFDSHAAVSAFLTSPFLWTDLAPYLKILLFQADSILCSAAPGRVDDFMDYDLVGAPIDARLGSGFNGGLSLRNRELVLRVLERWDFAADSGGADAPREWKFEDQWFFARMRELGEDKALAGELGLRVQLPDQATAERFAVETIWVEGQRPLGFHQPHRWQSEHMGEIMEYCPEVGMIAGSSFFG